MKSFKKLSKNALLNKKKLINGWLHIDSISSAKIVSKKSFDTITIDLQHGMLDFSKCVDIINIVASYNIFPVVRVPSNDIGIINKVIDAGAFGVICPLINNKNDVEVFTNSCFYPPKGNRSFGPTLVNIDYENYFEESNAEILTIAMVETKESVINLSDILKNKNLDMIYIGPYDLSISHGVKPNKVFEDKLMLDLYKQILNKARNNNKKVAIHCSGADIGNYFLEIGFDMVTISSDLNILNRALEEELNKIL